MLAIIYKATNIIDNKSYVGFTTKKLEQRIKAHIHSMNSGSNYYFHNAIRKYGIDSFKWEILYESFDVENTLKVIEPLLIKEHKSHETEEGYNMSWGGDNVMLGRKHSQKTIEKMKLRKLSVETKEKMRKSKLGVKLTEEHKSKIRAYKHTDSARINISRNHGFKSGRPGHGDKLREFYKNNPNKSMAGKYWVKDITGKRVWVETAQAY
jgi:group I intron endonuclease